MVHFQRNVLAHVPTSSMGEVAEDLKAIFKLRRKKTALALAEEFAELYRKRVVAGFGIGQGGQLAIAPGPGLSDIGFARRVADRC
jgi:putative transposase